MMVEESSRDLVGVLITQVPELLATACKDKDAFFL